MLIRGNVEGKAYKELMNHIVSKSDVLSVTVRLDPDREIDKKVMNILMNSSEYDINDIVNDYSEEYLEKIAEKNKENSLIFDEEAIQEERQNVKYIKNFSEEHRKKLYMIDGKII